MSPLTKNALVIEGGAMRSVFSAGLLDGFLDQDFNPFDMYIGVSAGAFNLTNYLACNRGKSIRLLLEITGSKQFINYWRFLRGGHLLDLDWLSQEKLFSRNVKLDDIYLHGKPFIICTTELETGRPAYIETSQDNLEAAIKASSALPLIYRGFPSVSGIAMTDGGIADGIPITEAIRRGATRIMVVRSRHKNYTKQDTAGHKLVRWKLRRYPQLVNAMRNRIRIFENTMAVIRNPPDKVEILEICPEQEFSMGRFCRNPKKLMRGYYYGYEQAVDRINDWKNL